MITSIKLFSEYNIITIVCTTSALRRSINAKVTQTNTQVIGTVGTNLSYAKTHELGLTIPSHMIYPRRGDALKFTINGKFVFARSVNMPAVKMPARPFLKPAYAEKKAEMKATIKQAINSALKP